MKHLFKKTAAAIAAGALICSAASCGNTTGTALTVNDTDIRAGIYIYYQMQAASDARSKLSEEQPDLDMSAEDFDLLKQTIEGTAARDWIKNKAIELCKEHVAVDKLVDEHQIALSGDIASNINSSVNSLWTEENQYAQYYYGVDIVGQYYEKYGIGKQSFKDTYTSSYKRDLLFDHIYGDGGEKAPSDDEVAAAIKEDRVLAKYFEVDPTIASAQSLVDKLNDGAAFADIKQEYDTLKEVAEIEADIAEAAENGEEYDGPLPADVNVEKKDEKDLQTVVSKSSSFSEDLVNALFGMSVGENKVLTITTSTTNSDGEEVSSTKEYVAQLLDIGADDDVMAQLRSEFVHKLKDDEFEKLISDTAAGYSVTENTAAINKYKAEKVLDQ